jgi:hypothetical protein
MARNRSCPRCGWIEPDTVAGPVQCKHCGEIFQPPDEAQEAGPGVENWWMDPAAAPAGSCPVSPAPADQPAQAADSGGEKWWMAAPLPVAASTPVVDPAVARAVSPFAAGAPAEENTQGLCAADWVVLGLGALLAGVGLIGLLVLFPCLVIAGSTSAVVLLLLGLIGAGLIVGALRQRMAVAAVIGGSLVAMLVAGIVFAGRFGGQGTAHDVTMPEKRFAAANTPQAAHRVASSVPASGKSPATTPASSTPPTAAPTTSAGPPVVRKIEDQKAAQGQTVRVSEKPFDVRDAVYLIEVQINSKLIPFATSCAINETTLLTSAREAAQLVYWRKNGVEQRILVCNERGVKREVEEIRALHAFTPLFTEELLDKSKKTALGREEPAAGSKPPNWLYFDLALLTVEEKLPVFAPLASADDLKALEDGLPLLCVGCAHDGKMISKDKLPKLQSGSGSIYLITTIPPSGPPAVERPPRLLHVDGEIPTHWVDDPDDTAAKRKVPFRAYGSPLFNPQGKLVAVYADTPPKGDKPMLLHLAPVVNPSLIERWIGGEANHTEDIQTWTLPDVFSPPAKPAGNP